MSPILCDNNIISYLPITVIDTSFCASGCGLGRDVCSVGSIQCAGCYTDGFSLPTNDLVGSCIGKLFILMEYSVGKQ